MIGLLMSRTPYESFRPTPKNMTEIKKTTKIALKGSSFKMHFIL